MLLKSETMGMGSLSKDNHSCRAIHADQVLDICPYCYIAALMTLTLNANAYFWRLGQIPRKLLKTKLHRSR